MKPIPLALVAAASLTACWELPPGDITSPYFWSEVFLDKYADDLVVRDLEPGPPPLEEPRTVLLITGVTIEAEWFGPIAARLERDGFVPVVYEPPDLLSGDLGEASEDLIDVVDRVLAESGQDRIDILAECTGGVIARHYLQSLGGADKVSRLVTFVSPHHGVHKAPWAHAIVGWPALRDLSPGSDFLRAVNDQPLPPNVPVTSIYTCTDEYIQPYETSIIEGANNIEICDGFVGHFETLFDPDIYLLMHEALVEPTPAELALADTVADDDHVVASQDSAGADDAALEPRPGAPAQAVEDPEREGLACASGHGGGSQTALVLLALLAVAGLRSARRRGHAID